MLEIFLMVNQKEIFALPEVKLQSKSLIENETIVLRNSNNLLLLKEDNGSKDLLLESLKRKLL